MKNKELAYKVFEFVQFIAEGDIQEMHIYSSDYSNMVIAKDGKQISVSVSVQEVEKDGN